MIISKTPLRISLCGGGTDFFNFYKHHKGKVISCAINQYVYVIIKKRFEKKIVINYSKHETVENVEDIKHDLIRECLKYYNIKDSVEITTLGDIPSEGTGLGSSSAITVGLLNAMSVYVGQPETQHSLAEIACHIELNVLKNPIGKQDQYITSFGGINLLSFNKNETVDVETYKSFPELYDIVNNNLLLHYTDITRKSSSILQEQTNNISSKTESLLEINKLTDRLNKNIKKNNDIIGKTLKDSWEIKKSLANGISNKTIDEMITLAENNGSVGSKISGAGGGGFLLSYVPIEKQKRYREEMKQYQELLFNVDIHGSRIIFNIL